MNFSEFKELNALKLPDAATGALHFDKALVGITGSVLKHVKGVSAASIDPAYIRSYAKTMLQIVPEIERRDNIVRIIRYCFSLHEHNFQIDRFIAAIDAIYKSPTTVWAKPVLGKPGAAVPNEFFITAFPDIESEASVNSVTGRPVFAKRNRPTLNVTAAARPVVLRGLPSTPRSYFSPRRKTSSKSSKGSKGSKSSSKSKGSRSSTRSKHSSKP